MLNPSAFICAYVYVCAGYRLGGENVSNVRLENYTQIGRKKQLDRVVHIIKGIGGIDAITKHKANGTYLEFLSYVAFTLGCSRKLAQDYIDTAIQAARFRSLVLDGEDILKTVNEIV